MAIFGVPAVHEDDALRAVRAATELRDGLAQLNDELEEAYGTRLELRMGVNTGEVVTGTGERLATGDAVNVAARLEQAAQPGEVLLGEETYRLVRTAVQVEAAPPIGAKGKAEPVTAFRLLAMLGDASAVARRQTAPMVGRVRQRKLLEDAFANVVSDRTCHLFTILGTAGVGKSRLVAEFLRLLDGDFEPRVRQGSVRAVVFARRGDFAAAEEALREAERRLEPTDYLPVKALVAMRRAEVARLAARVEEEREALAQALSFAERKGDLVTAARARSRLSELS